MRGAPYRQNEDQTLLALEALEVLDTAAEAEFEAIVHAASVVCRVPISLISLIDERRQWFKARVGLPNVMETNRDIAFCAHTVLGDELFEVPDTLSDPRFIDNPLVTGAPHIRFYAGVPITDKKGLVLGSFSVMDDEPREMSEDDLELLTSMAKQLMLDVRKEQKQGERPAAKDEPEVAVDQASSESDQTTRTGNSPGSVPGNGGNEGQAAI